MTASNTSQDPEGDQVLLIPVLPVPQATFKDHLRVEFVTPGDPVPQGSKTVGRTKDGRPFVREGNRKLRPWRDRVEQAARDAMNGQPLLLGPLRLEVTFTFRRPASHYGTGRNAGTLKPSAPTHVQTRPDLDKLLRAVGDALTGTVCRDDAQLATVHATKLYGDHAGAEIAIVQEKPIDSPEPRQEVLLMSTPEPEPTDPAEPDPAEPDPTEPDDDGDDDPVEQRG